MKTLLQRRALVVTLLVLLLVASAISLYALTKIAPTTATSSQAGGRALIGGPFTLVNQDGDTMTEADFAGRHMLIYFGYSYCPDICPMSLQTMTTAYDELPSELQAEVEPIFITVDPERDTVDAMADYVGLFHPDLTGLTGSTEQVDAAAKAYRVYHAKAKDNGSTTEYLVDHSSFYYLMGPDGQYIRHFGHDSTEEDIAAGIKEIIG